MRRAAPLALCVPALLASLAGCRGGRVVPGRDTDYAREQVARARSAPSVPAQAEGKALLDAAAKLLPLAAAEATRISEGGETEGLLDLDAPGAREFLATVADAAKGDAALASGPLDVERVLLATYARNPDVAAARASWRSAVRMYEQATVLEDVLLRYRAFATTASPRVATGPSGSMGEPLFPYPGVVALKGEMVAAEVAMAREDARMRLRDALSSAAMAFLETAHHTEELAVRDEQVAFADRMVAAARAQVASGKSPQAELLEMEAELAMAQNQRAHAVSAGTAARGRLNTLLARDPSAAVVASPLSDPPEQTPPVEPWLALAAKYAPEARAARAEADETAVAIRMAEAMRFSPPAPGAIGGGGESMDAGPAAPSMPAPKAAGAGGDSMGGGGAAPAPAGGSLPAVPLPGAPQPPATAPAGLGLDLAWIAQLRERKVALDREIEAAERATASKVVEAHYEMDAGRRMHAVSARSTVPLARRAVEERLRLYESGRSGFAELFSAYRRFLEARHDEVAGRYEYGEALAKAWMAAGARPSVAEKATGGGK